MQEKSPSPLICKMQPNRDHRQNWTNTNQSHQRNQKINPSLKKIPIHILIYFQNFHNSFVSTQTRHFYSPPSLINSTKIFKPKSVIRVNCLLQAYLCLIFLRFCNFFIKFNLAFLDKALFEARGYHRSGIASHCFASGVIGQHTLHSVIEGTCIL